MPPVTRSRGTTAVKSEPSPPVIHVAPAATGARRKSIPVPAFSQHQSDADTVGKTPNSASAASTAAAQVFQLTLQGRPLTFTSNAAQFRSTIASSNLGYYHQTPDPLGLQRQAVTLRPAGMTSQIILYADSPVSVNVNRQLLPVHVLPGRVAESPQAPSAKATSLKHSLRLVRGATTAGWSVVPPPLAALKTDVKKPAATRSRSKKVQGAVSVKGVVRRQKRRCRTLDTSQTRSSTSTESFRSDCLGADGSSLSGSSNDDSKLTGADPSLSSRQSSVSLDEPFGVLPSYTQRQREAMAVYYRADPSAGTRYTALKEWAMAKGTKFFHSGNIRLSMKARVSALLYGNGSGDSVSVNAVEDVREAVRLELCDKRVDDFKRRLCLEIIKSRDPNYAIYGGKSLPGEGVGEPPLELSTECSAAVPMPISSMEPGS